MNINILEDFQICINVPLMKKKLKGIFEVLCSGGSII